MSYILPARLRCYGEFAVFFFYIRGVRIMILILLQGFRKIDLEKWEFANDDFVKGQLRQLKNSHRQKPVHSHSLKNQESRGSSSPMTEEERQ